MPEDIGAERIGVEAEFGVKDFIHNADLYDEVLKRTGARTADWALSMQQAVEGGSDKEKAFVGKMIADMVELEERANKLKAAQTEYADSTESDTARAESGWKMFTQSAIGNVMDFKAKLYVAQTALNAFMKPFKEYIQIGLEGVAQLRTQKQFANMLGPTEDYTEALEDMRTVTRGTVKDSQLMASAMKIMRMGMADTAEDAAKVVRNVTMLSKAAGQFPSPESAMQVFSMMMSNQSKMRLDAFGLTISEVDARIEKLKQTMGVSEAEAFRIAVFELMNERVESMGLNVEDASTKLDQMNVAFQNIGDQMKVVLVPEFNQFIDLITGWGKSVAEHLPNIEAAYVKFVSKVRANFMQLGAVAKVLAMDMKGLVLGLQGDFDAAGAMFDAAGKVWETEVAGWATYYETFESEVRRHYEGVTIAAQDSAAKQAEAARQAAAEAAAIKDAWDQATVAAQEKTDEKLTAITTKETWAVIDAVIAANRKREDEAKATAKRIEQIELQYATAVSQAMNQYNAAVANAQTQYSRQMLQIEENYQKAKRDILRRYEMDEWEAISERDATALIKAQRNRDDQLRQADESKADQEKQASQQYSDALNQAQQALAQQQEAARQSYVQQQADLQVSLQTQEEQQRISDARKAEDATRARDRERGAILQAQGQAIADAYIAYSAEYVAAQQHYQDMLGQVNAFVANVQAAYRQLPSWVPPQAMPGYSPNPVRTGPSFGAPPWVTAQRGAYFMANKQTNLTVGEHGRELVMVQPMRNVPATAGAANVNHIVTGKISAQVQATIRNSMAGYEGRISAAVSQALGQVFRQ